MIDETLFEAEEKMESAVEHAKEEFAAIRTGRATPAMFSKIMVDYYGAPTPVTQMASIGVPEPRMVIVKPYDAIAARPDRAGDPRLRPRGQPEQRGHPAAHPPAADDRGAPPRDDQGGARQGGGGPGGHPQRPPQGQGAARPLVKDGEAGEDDGRRAEKELDDVTHRYVSVVDELVKHKEAELLEV